MANTKLKTIQFPGLPDTYTVPQVENGTNNNVAVLDGAGNVKDSAIELSKVATKEYVEDAIRDAEIDSVDGLNGGTIKSSTTIKADSNKDYALTVQSNATDTGGAYEGGAYIGFRNKIGNVLGYLGVDRDKDAVLNKGGKDYKLGFPISDYIRGRRMFNSQGAVTLPFGTIAVTVDSNLTVSWYERQGASLIPQSITTHGPCIMFITKIGNSGVKNENTLASGIIAYKTNDLDFFDTRKFLTNTRIQVTGNAMLYYISTEDLGTDP